MARFLPSLRLLRLRGRTLHSPPLPTLLSGCCRERSNGAALPATIQASRFYSRDPPHYDLFGKGRKPGDEEFRRS